MRPSPWLASILVLAAGAARAENPVTTTGQSLELNGYASLELEKMLSHEGDGDPNGAMDLRNLDLIVNWHGSERLRVASDIGFEHGVSTDDKYGNVVLQYGFIEYELKDWARLRGGKMFTPFGIYNEFHTAKTAILTVKEPRATGKIDDLGAGKLYGQKLRPYPRWGTGVALLGNGPSPVGEWDYVVMVANGESRSDNPFEKDDNAQKSVTGRVRLQANEHVEVGASYYTDWITEYDPGTETLVTPNRTRLTSYGAQVTWRPGRVLGVEAEYTGTNLRPPEATGDRDVWSHGVYVMAFGAFSPTWIPYARWEWFDPDTAVAHDQGQIFLAGLAVRVPGNLLLKAEVDAHRVGVNNRTYADGLGNYSELLLAAAVGF